jgi:arylformamidase
LTRRILDISPPLSDKIAVWPGDTPFTREVLLDIAGGANLTLSGLRSTVHLGSHADAPSHYHGDGASIDQVALDPYLGPCEVVAVEKPPGGLIEAADCAGVIARGARRVLFRTGSAPDPTRFDTDFVSFAAEAIEALGKAGVVLVGIDTPSVDPFSSKDLPAHQALFRWKMRNLEGLLLEQVAEGSYELVALPLKLVGFDASPVRAVLIAPARA